MIEDILYDPTDFLLELQTGEPGGNILAYSSDGANFDVKSLEISSIFIT